MTIKSEAEHRLAVAVPWREATGKRVLARESDGREIRSVIVVQVTPGGIVEILVIPPAGPSAYVDPLRMTLLEVLE